MDAQLERGVLARGQDVDVDVVGMIHHPLGEIDDQITQLEVLGPRLAPGVRGARG